MNVKLFFDLVKNPPDSGHVVSWFVALLDNCVKALRIRTLDCWKREESETVRGKSRVVLPADSDGLSSELSTGFITSSHACTRSTCLSHHRATGAIRQKVHWLSLSGSEYSTGTEADLAIFGCLFREGKSPSPASFRERWKDSDC